MKKLIGIVSYNFYSQHMNYGASLHSYAFQQYLRKLNVDSIIIAYIPKLLDDYNLKYPILNYNRIKSVKGFFAFIANWGLGFFSNIRKYNKFQLFFENKYIMTKKVYHFSDLMRLPNIEEYKFTDFVCESDIIWKLFEENGFDECFFLKFPAADGLNKVAYSPTIGSREFSDNEKERFLSLISDFSAISVRESQGAEYLSRILHRKIDWVLDPTLLLERDDYDKISVKPKENGYVLLYVCMVDDLKMVKEARRFAARQGKKLIEISNFYVNKFLFNHKILTDIGIEEFLGYIKNADFVICNAFHGFCLSVIYKKEVFLFLRNKKDYRMQNITSALGLYDRLIDIKSKEIPQTFTPINYENVYKHLAIHRKRSKDFIDNFLSRS